MSPFSVFRGPVAGRYDNISSIALIGSAHDKAGGSFAFNEPTSMLQWGLQKLDLTWANGSRSNVSYQEMFAEDGMYIPHTPPDPDRQIPHRNPGSAPAPMITPDTPYFDFLDE